MLIKLTGARRTHGAGAPRRRQGHRLRREPRLLRHRPPLHRARRRGGQGRLPRGPRAGQPGRAPRRRGQPRRLRLRLRRRRQAQLRQLPRAAAPPGARRRHHRVRQHALVRDRGHATGDAHVGHRQEVLGRHQGPQRSPLRGRAR
ncbi:Caffeoyl-CoA O-methyltransferase 1 [Zea mays]|uniref:Caffeoyl-CoA O-methyltransferase 1 n=1 Tax=Zea mays TaxID=4577 RepID=A0A1D6QKD4_MAIZE|nr:Caffeoyl-CoA O-methyltransferase 1 [Zea mays]